MLNDLKIKGGHPISENLSTITVGDQTTCLEISDKNGARVTGDFLATGDIKGNDVAFNDITCDDITCDDIVCDEIEIDSITINGSQIDSTDLIIEDSGDINLNATNVTLDVTNIII